MAENRKLLAIILKRADSRNTRILEFAKISFANINPFKII